MSANIFVAAELLALRASPSAAPTKDYIDGKLARDFLYLCPFLVFGRCFILFVLAQGRTSWPWSGAQLR